MTPLMVLGAGGFMGRAVRRALRTAGHELLCIDRVDAGADEGEEWHTFDLLDRPHSALRTMITASSAAAVINCSGLVSGEASELVRANVEVVARIVSDLDGMDVRLVHLGSAAEYGAGVRGTPVDEADPAWPTTPYAITKLAGTQLVRSAVTDGRLQGVVLRIFNPVGPDMPATSMPGRAVQLIRDARMAGSSSITMGPLDAWRDFVDLRDVGRAIVLAVNAETVPEPILNVGSGQAVLARDLVHAIAAAAGWGGEVQEVELLGSPRSAAIDWQQASTRRIAEVLSWRTQHSLLDAARAAMGA
jgi:NDP-hexose 4-ketoreductase